MSSISKVTDEEVACAIRYLDPDLYDDPGWHSLRQTTRFGWWARTALIVAAVFAALYFSALKYLPAIIRLSR